MYERSDKHATSLKGLLCCRYVKHIDKLKGFKSEWIKSGTNFYRQQITKIRLLTASGETIIKSERCTFGSYKWVEKCFSTILWILLKFFFFFKKKKKDFRKCPTEFYFFGHHVRQILKNYFQSYLHVVLMFLVSFSCFLFSHSFSCDNVWFLNLEQLRQK